MEEYFAPKPFRMNCLRRALALEGNILLKHFPPRYPRRGEGEGCPPAGPTICIATSSPATMTRTLARSCKETHLGCKRRILLVDDEVTVLLTMKAVLEISGLRRGHRRLRPRRPIED